jgi:thioesterase DpgC
MSEFENLYREITDGFRRFVRVEDLVLEAAERAPHLLPSADELAEERSRRLAEKKGVELRQGEMLSRLAAIPEIGRHMCHAMLLPRPESAAALERFRRDGRLDLGKAMVERRGAAAVVTHVNPERLNCEDDSTIAPLETAIDVATLDPDSKVCILRGAKVAHPKYAGRRLFGSGINLTDLYWGKISFVGFYLTRDMGLVNKLYRGVARPDADPDEVAGGTREKLWIAAVEGFAIGGACQLLLAVDHAIAEQSAYMTLPARKEGIIPGAANLRLTRFLGAQLARQAILNDRRIDCASPEGRMICSDVVPDGEMDTALDRTVEVLATSGVVSTEGNRRALRLSVEPFDLFRQYIALYAREQAHCHLSPALVANLERFWNAASKR